MLPDAWHATVFTAAGRGRERGGERGGGEGRCSLLYSSMQLSQHLFIGKYTIHST